MPTSPRQTKLTKPPQTKGVKGVAKKVATPNPFVLEETKLIFLKPEVALRVAKLKPGHIVADLGCGAGFLSIPAAIQVGSQGMVYAVDILKDNLAQVRSQAKLFNLPNVQTIWADLEVPGSTGLPDTHTDVTLLFKVLCQQRSHEAIFSEAKRVTKTGGLILVAEWCEPVEQIGNGMGATKESLLSRQELLSLGKKVGLRLEREHRLDDFHYVLEYRRP